MRKTFGSIVAVDGVDLALAPGVVHALVGENGAGKSTLAAICAGTFAPDAGSVERRGSVGLVHQHFTLVERLRVWENIVLGHEPRRGLRIDVAAARARVRDLAARYGLEVDPDAYVATLPIGVRQRVELLRELARAPAVLLLDEPTAALAPSEIAAFFVTVRGLAAGGAAVLVVTHKLAEVMAYAERVTVMRRGRIVGDHRVAETDAAALAREMVGGEVPPIAARAVTAGGPGLAVTDLVAGEGAGALRGVSFAVAAGEIVGIAGVEGNGQSALADAIAGIVPARGEIVLAGTPLASSATPAQRLARGLRAIPQDRGAEGLVLPWTVRDNVLLGRQRTLAVRRGVTIDRGASTSLAHRLIERYDVRPPDPEAVAGALSGGNQQKIVVGRALDDAPRAVVAYQPTRGVDVGAAALLHSRLMEARNAGVAVLLISFELDELLALADRILVVFNGAITGTFSREGFDRARIGALMAGGA